MARPPKPDAQIVEAPIDEAAFVQAGESLNTLALANSETSAGAQALAVELGYDGALSVGALEDEIRFYQRRTVEAILETGKRLLLLKEMTPHGEFAQRVEMLGFAKTTAFRFMQAATKTAKSSKLELLSSQVKNASAFLELVTHDDDADLERLAELDDIDRMSASQLRDALREIKEEAKAKDQLLEDKNKRIDKLHAAQQRIQSAPPDEVLADLKREATAMATEAEGMVLGRLRHALIALNNHGDERGQQAVFMAGLLGQVQRQLNALREEFGLPDAGANTPPEWQQWADQQGAAPGTESVLIDSAH